MRDFGEDGLKKYAKITEPDVRQSFFVKIDHKGNQRPITLEDQYKLVETLNLHDGVPEDICIHFETAKNLFLYSWFVYRFGAVAEYHSLITLEFALKTRSGGQIKGLKKLLNHAIGKGWLKNEGFSVWRARKLQDEQNRQIYESISNSKGQKYDFVEKEFDYVNVLSSGLPEIRNHYLHGSPTFDRANYGHLLIISEAINQLFDNPTTA